MQWSGSSLAQQCDPCKEGLRLLSIPFLCWKSPVKSQFSAGSHFGGQSVASGTVFRVKVAQGKVLILPLSNFYRYKDYVRSTFMITPFSNGGFNITWSLALGCLTMGNLLFMYFRRFQKFLWHSQACACSDHTGFWSSLVCECKVHPRTHAAVIVVGKLSFGKL